MVPVGMRSHRMILLSTCQASCIVISRCPTSVQAPFGYFHLLHFHFSAMQALSLFLHPLYAVIFPHVPLICNLKKQQQQLVFARYQKVTLIAKRLLCTETPRIRTGISTMPTRNYAFSRADEATHPDSMRATLAEFLSTFVFVFAGEGSVLALDKIYKDLGQSTGTTTAPGLVMVALAHGLALFSAVAAAVNVSGGHVNPAVTFGALCGGRLSVIRALYYWVAQLLGSVLAALLLRISTSGMRPQGFQVASGVGELHALVLEIVLTYGLVYTVYGTAIDPKRGSLGIIAPLAIGLIVGANILVGGPFDGAAMNPARAFGPSLVGWRWHNHWIYWVGPLVGGGLAALIYEYLVIPTEPQHHTHQPLAPEDY